MKQEKLSVIVNGREGLFDEFMICMEVNDAV
jgi:hypothetical protein